MTKINDRSTKAQIKDAYLASLAEVEKLKAAQPNTKALAVFEDEHRLVRSYGNIEATNQLSCFFQFSNWLDFIYFFFRNIY